MEVIISRDVGLGILSLISHARRSQMAVTKVSLFDGDAPRGAR
jgi:hypothetical protein